MSLKDDIRDKATDIAVQKGAEVAAKGLRAIFDRAARKRPNGLVARFRRFFGITRPEQTMPEQARTWAEELYPHPDKTPSERPSAKRGVP